MHCANSQCCRDAEHFSQGTLWLVELELPSAERITGEESGFPICTAPSRYFWLCPDCSKSLQVERWTLAEVVVGRRQVKKPVAIASMRGTGRLPSLGVKPEAADFLVRTA